jgi:hypothetical protein
VQGYTTYLTILKLLGEFRFLTTGQLQRRVLPQRRVQRFREYLARLRDLGMVTAFPYEPERGKSSELCWLLLKAGAAEISLRYNTHFRRRPTRERIRFREVELQLEEQVSEAGWKLVKPQSYNRVKPLPERTEQFFRLAHALEPQGKGFAADLCVPINANDYVAYTHDGKQAVVLILCPPRATEKFWFSRVQRYRQLARRLKVVAVFEEPTQLKGCRSFLEKEGLLVTVVGLVGQGLRTLNRPV